MMGTPWARFEITTEQLRKQNLDKHDKSRTHTMAMAGQTTNAPADADWTKTLNSLAQHSSTKDRVMRWCLHEALKAVQWRALGKNGGVCTIALAQDVRNHRLLMRLTASTPAFEQLTFCVGQARCTGTDSYDLAQTTRALLR